MTRVAGLALAAASLACVAGALGPAPLDTRNEACAHCRMAVSEARFAAQIVAPGEVPRFFDDLGCLAADLRDRRPGAGSAVFVADHRSRSWIPAATAVYSRVPAIATPMGSHLIAHADAASRERDTSAAGGTAITAREIFGDALPAGSPR